MQLPEKHMKVHKGMKLTLSSNRKKIKGKYTHVHRLYVCVRACILDSYRHQNETCILRILKSTFTNI